MRKTKEEAQQTKEQLVDSALELFLIHGYSKVNLNQIVDYVNLTRGAFYWHFKSKEEILEAIVSREKLFIENLMVDLFTRNDLSPDQQIKLVLESIVSNFFDNEKYRNFVELTWMKLESGQHNVNHQKTIANDFFIEETTKIIRKGSRSGVFSKEEKPLVWSLQIASTINGIYRLYFISPSYMSKGIALKIVNNLHKTMSIPVKK